jgi:predicted N-formylglutamate amidohydrolase
MNSLLGADEMPAVDVREGRGPFVIVCEHASNRLPRALGTLGLSASDLRRHIAWDPGAAEIAAGLMAVLGGDLVLQRYSRLAIDCNREPGLPDAITVRSEDTEIPGNAALDAEHRSSRVQALWTPFHDAIDGVLNRRLREAPGSTMLITVHTFTPVYRGVARPWHAGIISTDDRELPDAILATLRRERGLVIGDNEPYSAKDNVDYTIRRHGRERGIPHAMIEIRNDLVADVAGQKAWIERLAAALKASRAALAA